MYYLILLPGTGFLTGRLLLFLTISLSTMSCKWEILKYIYMLNIHRDSIRGKNNHLSKEAYECPSNTNTYQKNHKQLTYYYSGSSACSTSVKFIVLCVFDGQGEGNGTF